MMTITYPRSGSHYLRDLVIQKLDIRLDASHIINDAKGLVITIARNPYDSIHSNITMALHYGNKIDIQQIIFLYVDLYRMLYNRANVVIDYDTLVSSPEKIVEFLSDILGQPVNDHTYKNEMKDIFHENNLVSSKSS